MRRVVVFLLGPLGCAEGRQPLSVPIDLEPSEADFQVDDSVAVSVTDATLTLAHIRLEAPAELAHRRPRWSLIQAAHAHPGHDVAGSITGELLGTWTVDLLDEPMRLGDATCWEGDTATASLSLPAEPAVLIEGVATVDGDARPFSFTVEPDHPVTGLDLDTTLDASAPLSRIALQVDLHHLLSFVDWRTEASDTLLTTADGDLENTVTFGVLSSSSYLLSPED